MADEPDMVERVALAIKRKQIGSHTALSKGRPWREFEMDIARAAIEAMREPTEAMLDAAYERTWTMPTRAWGAMIDAALQKRERG